MSATVIPYGLERNFFIPINSQNDLFVWSLNKGSLCKPRQVTIQDHAQFNNRIQAVYRYKKKARLGYEEYKIPNFQEKIFISVKLKTAIETVIFCRNDIRQSSETTPVREVENLYQLHLKEHEYLIIHAGRHPKAITGKINNKWMIDPIHTVQKNGGEVTFLTDNLRATIIKAPLTGKARSYDITSSNKQNFLLATITRLDGQHV